MTATIRQSGAGRLKTATLWRWHSALGWIAGLAACLWVATGLMHTLMTWTTPRAAAMTPPAASFDGAQVPDLSRLFASVGAPDVSAASFIILDGKPHLYARPGGSAQAQVISLDTGKLVPDGDRARAIALARHYTGDAQSAVASARLVTAFDSAYPSVYRLLPVWRIELDRADGLAAYVDPSTGRLASLTTPQKTFLLWAFRTFHTFSFADEAEAARLALIAGLLLAILGGTAAGVGLLLRVKHSPKAPPLRRWHHRIGLIAWLPAALFAGSALLHLGVQSRFVTPEPVAAPTLSFKVDQLAAGALAGESAFTDARLVASAEGLTLWRLTLGESVVYIDALSGLATVLEDAQVAAGIAGVDAAALTEAPQRLTRFTDAYGFANKRLPVWQFTVADDLLFVDTLEGVIAARHRPIDALDAKVFAWAHKWEFLTEPVGRLVRDLVMVSAALTLAASALLGLWLKGRTRKKATGSRVSGPALT